jgi:hypothetical protein
LLAFLFLQVFSQTPCKQTPNRVLYRSPNRPTRQKLLLHCKTQFHRSIAKTNCKESMTRNSKKRKCLYGTGMRGGRRYEGGRGRGRRTKRRRPSPVHCCRSLFLEAAHYCRSLFLEAAARWTKLWRHGRLGAEAWRRGDARADPVWE